MLTDGIGLWRWMTGVVKEMKRMDREIQELKKKVADIAGKGGTCGS